MKKLDFEKKMLKILSQPSQTVICEEESAQNSGTCLDSVCMALLNKALKGDVSAIKYISEICSAAQPAEVQDNIITVRVVE